LTVFGGHLSVHVVSNGYTRRSLSIFNLLPGEIGILCLSLSIVSKDLNINMIHLGQTLFPLDQPQADRLDPQRRELLGQVGVQRRARAEVRLQRRAVEPGLHARARLAHVDEVGRLDGVLVVVALVHVVLGLEGGREEAALGVGDGAGRRRRRWSVVLAGVLGRAGDDLYW